MDEETPCKLQGWSNKLLSGILRYFEANLNCFFCAISSRELSVCAIFYTFSNYELIWKLHHQISERHRIDDSWHQAPSHRELNFEIINKLQQANIGPIAESDIVCVTLIDGAHQLLIDRKLIFQPDFLSEWQHFWAKNFGPKHVQSLVLSGKILPCRIFLMCFNCLGGFLFNFLPLPPQQTIKTIVFPFLCLAQNPRNSKITFSEKQQKWVFINCEE